jgi:hypothetical protein
MTLNLASLIEKAPTIRHHALLLLSRRFGEEGLSEIAFRGIAEAFCGMRLSNGEPEKFWEDAATHPDLVIVDRERNTLRIEDVAAIRTRAFFPPNVAKRRLFFIDRAERLNRNAANGLLKVLEEPNVQALFIFTARSVTSVLPTISSRCQRVLYCEDIQASKHPSQLIEPDDWSWLQNCFSRAARAEPVLIDSMWEKLSRKVDAAPLAEILEKSAQIGKKYPAKSLIDVCAALVSESFQKNAIIARYIVRDLSDWRNSLVLNPSPELWLGKILLRIL